MSRDSIALLHIGTNKTGTSAIQAWLADRRDALSNAGYLYPHACKWIHDHSHNSLPAAMLTAAEQGARANLDLHMGELEAEIARHPDKHLLMSSEMLEKAPRFAKENVDAFLRVLLKYYARVEIVYCLRDRATLCDSIFKQWVQDERTHFHGPPLQTVERELPGLDFEGIAADWLRTGRVACISGFWYDGLDQDANFRRFLAASGLAAGMPAATEFRTEAHNTSLDGVLLQVLHALNDRIRHAKGRAAFVDALREVAAVMPTWSTKTTIFDPISLAEFDARVSAFERCGTIRVSDFGIPFTHQQTNRTTVPQFVPVTAAFATERLAHLDALGHSQPMARYLDCTSANV